MTHLVYPGEFSADFYVLSLGLQAFRIIFDCAINDGEQWRGCRDCRGRDLRCIRPILASFPPFLRSMVVLIGLFNSF